RRKSDGHLHHVGLRRGSEGGQGSKERSNEPGGFAKEIIKGNSNRRVRCKALGVFLVNRPLRGRCQKVMRLRRIANNEQRTARSSLAHRTCGATAFGGHYRFLEFLPTFRILLVFSF